MGLLRSISFIVLAISTISALAPLASAQEQHTPLRQVAVFPVKAPKVLGPAAEEAWWKIRETLTDNKRFLVASKNFLLQKDVFQARGQLTPADAIILGKLLDADALITTDLIDRNLVMRVYEGEYGRPLWEHELQLHPSLPMAEQLVPAALRLINDFIASIPYQGYVIVDSLVGSPVFQDRGPLPKIKVKIGANAQVQQGDPVHLIRVLSTGIRPLFVDGSMTEVFAEGQVSDVDRDTITVEVERATQITDISEGTLVRLPKELQRLQSTYAIQDSLRKKIDPEFFSPEMTSTQQEVEERKPLVASLAYILNFAVFLLLAF